MKANVSVANSAKMESREAYKAVLAHKNCASSELVCSPADDLNFRPGTLTGRHKMDALLKLRNYLPYQKHFCVRFEW